MQFDKHSISPLMLAHKRKRSRPPLPSATAVLREEFSRLLSILERCRILRALPRRRELLQELCIELEMLEQLAAVVFFSALQREGVHAIPQFLDEQGSSKLVAMTKELIGNTEESPGFRIVSSTLQAAIEARLTMDFSTAVEAEEQQHQSLMGLRADIQNRISTWRKAADSSRTK